MRKLFVSAVLAIAAVGCSKGDPASSADHTKNLPELGVDEVDKGLTAKDLTAIDCNGDDTRKKYGTLPDAVLISDDEAYAPSELPADKARKLVFYCSSPS